MTKVTGARTRDARLIAGLVLALSGAACGGGGGGGTADGGGGAFTAAAPLTGVCGLLTTADIQTVMPGAIDGVEQQTANTDSLGFWSRDCKWDDATTATHSLELVVFGATTAQGLSSIRLAAASGQTNTPVSGLGTEAHYWVDGTHGTNGLWALEGSRSVDVTAYFFSPIPTEAQLHPLVAKGLGGLK
jgi:hypothetical protein